MLTGARVAVPSGHSKLVMGACMPRKIGRAKYNSKLLCTSKVHAGRALENESAHEAFSYAGLLNAEAFAGEPRKSYESAVASQGALVNDDALHRNSAGIHVSELFSAAQHVGSEEQDTDITKGVVPRKQILEEQKTVQDVDIGSHAPQKSVEEAFGFLKEQVETDRSLQLASKQGTEADDGIADTAKPWKRSKLLAKQVISQSSARAIGYVSQLWVSARLFKVIALEVRPSLLSGEIDRLFLGDVCQIGDVVLVTDESALESETTALDCETLVGYDIVTEEGQYIGKIRDYSFDLDDGELTSLDFDSVGFSLVPSSLISTFRLDAKEMIEVLPDCIVVRDGAESRIRRLSKGLWQLPAGGEKRRNQRMARSRMLKKALAEGDDIASMSRQLPANTRPRFFEGRELEGLDERAEPAERPSSRKDSGGSPRRYRSR